MNTFEFNTVEFNFVGKTALIYDIEPSFGKKGDVISLYGQQFGDNKGI